MYHQRDEQRAEKDDQQEENEHERHDYREEQIPEALVYVLVLAADLRRNVRRQVEVGDGPLGLRRDRLGVSGGDPTRDRDGTLPVGAADGHWRLYFPHLGDFSHGSATPDRQSLNLIQRVHGALRHANHDRRIPERRHGAVSEKRAERARDQYW
jgi:hypothetical protein